MFPCVIPKLDHLGDRGEAENKDETDPCEHKYLRPENGQFICHVCGEQVPWLLKVEQGPGKDNQ